MLSEALALLIAVALSVVGTVFKFIAWLGGSMAALVDAATCFASIVAGLVALWAFSKSREPPDTEHLYGHERYVVYGGILVIAIYSVVLGMVVDRLLYRVIDLEYSVSISAPIYVAIGTAIYLIAIAIARRGGLVGRTYATFISSEVLEGVVTICASLAGSLLSSLIDYVGGWVLTTYLAYEVFHELRGYEKSLTDWSEPRLVKEIEEMFRSVGIEVKSIRLRMVVPHRYVGDAVVMVGRDYDIEKAHEVVDDVVRRIRSRLGIDITVHYEPQSSRG